VASIKNFHHYLYGRKFKVRSDHGALSWLFNFKNSEGQLTRWFELLASYDFKIEHKAGRSHNNADALSTTGRSSLLVTQYFLSALLKDLL
jgi:hypothetical protein